MQLSRKLGAQPARERAKAIDGVSVPSAMIEYFGASGEKVSESRLSPCPVSLTATSVKTAAGGGGWISA